MTNVMQKKLDSDRVEYLGHTIHAKRRSYNAYSCEVGGHSLLKARGNEMRMFATVQYALAAGREHVRKNHQMWQLEQELERDFPKETARLNRETDQLLARMKAKDGAP